jgi:hypothetical protein
VDVGIYQLMVGETRVRQCAGNEQYAMSKQGLMMLRFQLSGVLDFLDQNVYQSMEFMLFREQAAMPRPYLIREVAVVQGSAKNLAPHFWH